MSSLAKLRSDPPRRRAWCTPGLAHSRRRPTLVGVVDRGSVRARTGPPDSHVVMPPVRWTRPSVHAAIAPRSWRLQRHCGVVMPAGVPRRPSVGDGRLGRYRHSFAELFRCPFTVSPPSGTELVSTERHFRRRLVRSSRSALSAPKVRRFRPDVVMRDLSGEALRQNPPRFASSVVHRAR